MFIDYAILCSYLVARLPLFLAAVAEALPAYEPRAIQLARSAAYQAELYAKGRTIAGPNVDALHPLGRKVTWADGVHTLSNHQVQRKHVEWKCHAADVGLFLRATGAYVQDDGLYKPFRPIAISVGLRSGWEFEDDKPPHEADPDHIECDPQRCATPPAGTSSTGLSN